MNIVYVVILSCLLFGLPGILLHLNLREKGMHVIPSIGVGFSFILVLYSIAASFFGYSFYLHLSIIIVVDFILLCFLISRKRLQVQFPSGIESWQWLLFFVLILFYLGPAFVISVPFDTDAQGFGLLVATVKQSGSINTLAPFYPNIEWYYSPGFFLMCAQLVDILHIGIHEVMLGFSHLLSLAVIVSMGALGRRMGGPTTGWWCLIACSCGMALYTTLMDAAYTNIFGLWLTVTFLWTLDYVMKNKSVYVMLLSGVCLSAVLLGHPDSIIHLVLGYLCFYLGIFLIKDSVSISKYFRVMFAVPLIGIVVSLPWLVVTFPTLLEINVHERQSPQIHHLIWMFTVNGGVIPLFAIFGLWWSVRKRHWLDIWSITWLVPIVEISSLGNLDVWSRKTVVDPFQVFYPFGMAWHATIIPFALLASRGLEPIGNRISTKIDWRKFVSNILVVLVFLMVNALIFNKNIISLTRNYIPKITGAIASDDDILAYEWLRDNTPEDSIILNYPGRYEGQWVTVISERASVYIRDQLFYIGAEDLRELQDIMVNVYLDPDSVRSYGLIIEHGIDYLVVPSWINVESFQGEEMRWSDPDKLLQISSFRDADYLTLVASFNEAQIWKIIH